MELNLSTETVAALKRSMKSRNTKMHAQTTAELEALLDRAMALPSSKRETLMLLVEPKSPEGAELLNGQVIRLSAGSYTILKSTANGHTQRVMLMKRIGGQAKAFFDSEQIGVTEISLVKKAIYWFNATLATLENT